MTREKLPVHSAAVQIKWENVRYNNNNNIFVLHFSSVSYFMHTYIQNILY